MSQLPERDFSDPGFDGKLHAHTYAPLYAMMGGPLLAGLGWVLALALGGAWVGVALILTVLCVAAIVMTGAYQGVGLSDVALLERRFELLAERSRLAASHAWERPLRDYRLPQFSALIDSQGTTVLVMLLRHDPQSDAYYQAQILESHRFSTQQWDEAGDKLVELHERAAELEVEHRDRLMQQRLDQQQAQELSLLREQLADDQHVSGEQPLDSEQEAQQEARQAQQLARALRRGSQSG